MKKLSIMLLIIGVAFFISSSAYAYDYGVEVGDQVKATSNGATGGGEFAMVADNGYSWTSFCLERDEFITINQYDWVGGISDEAVLGGIGGPSPDPLADQTAWLFWNFTQGSLTGYDSSVMQDQNDLQNLIWFYEDEGIVGSWTAQMNTWKSLADAAVSNWTNNGKVAVLNLYDTKNAARSTVEYTNPRQDVLISVVPEPATMLLFGIGLLGIAGISRKKA